MDDYREIQELYAIRAKKKRIQAYFFVFVAVVLVLFLFLSLNKGIREYSQNRLTYEQLQSYVENVSRFSKHEFSQSKLKTLDSLLSEPREIASILAAYDNSSLIADASTRIILMVVGFFLVQIFLNLYKYSMNSSDFYLSISDIFRILQLEGVRVEKVSIKELFELLRANNADVGTPQSPLLSSLSKIISD